MFKSLKHVRPFTKNFEVKLNKSGQGWNREKVHNLPWLLCTGIAEQKWIKPTKTCGKTEFYHWHSQRPSSITANICPLQFYPFIHAVSKSNSAIQHIIPISFILLGKQFGSDPIRLTTVSYDEIILRQQQHAMPTRALAGHYNSENSHQSPKCITSHAALFFITLLYYCVFVAGVQNCLIKFHRRQTPLSVWVFIRSAWSDSHLLSA